MGDTNMSEEVPLRPVGREEIHKLETALLIGTLLRPDVLEEIRKSEERITWIDSLAVAAGALARAKAGMPVSEIAEDLGRSEGTIRNHLAGKTKAGKLVMETYERIKREGFKIHIPELAPAAAEELRKQLEEEKKRREELERKLEELQKALEEERRRREEAEERLAKVREELSKLLGSL